MFLPYALGVVADAEEKLSDLTDQIANGRKFNRELLASRLYEILFELRELATELEQEIEQETGEPYV